MLLFLLFFVLSCSVSQSKLEQTEAELRSLAKEFQGLRNSLAQRDTSVLQLQSTITTLTQKLTAAHRKEVQTSTSTTSNTSICFVSTPIYNMYQWMLY